MLEASGKRIALHIAHDGTVEVTWADDGSRTHVAFGPPEVSHARP